MARPLSISAEPSPPGTETPPSGAKTPTLATCEGGGFGPQAGGALNGAAPAEVVTTVAGGGGTLCRSTGICHSGGGRGATLTEEAAPEMGHSGASSKSTACQTLFLAHRLAPRLLAEPRATMMGVALPGLTLMSSSKSCIVPKFVRETNQASLERPVQKNHNTLLAGLVHRRKCVMASRIAISLQTSHSQNPHLKSLGLSSIALQ